MNDNADEISITITVTGNFGDGETTREVKITGRSEEEIQELLDKTTEFIKKQSGNSY